jgi:hypothetical protein
MSNISFIKGNLKGRLGDIVGSSWKGKPYTKTYTPPSNPNTPAQIETRHLFQTIAHIGKGLRTPLELYVRPKPHKISVYNNLIQMNKPMFSKQGDKWAPLELVIMAGELTTTLITTAVFDSTALTTTVTWDGAKGDQTDKALVVVYDDESKHTVYLVETMRSAGTVTIDTSSFANVSTYNEIYVYLAFYNISDDGSGQNSNTIALKATKT